MYKLLVLYPLTILTLMLAFSPIPVHSQSSGLQLRLNTTTERLKEELQDKIQNQDYKQITSILINHKGVRIYENYFNDGSPEQLNDIRSASKTFTSLAMGIAIDKERLPAVTSRVMTWLPEYKSHRNPFPGKVQMSFRDLLTMTSPLECNDWNSYSLGNEERMYLQADWARFILDLPQRGIPPWEEPIEERFNQKAFSYCTGGVFIVGRAIESATNLRVDKYLQKHLFSHMEIEDLQWPYSPKGHAQTGGGVRISSQDLIKIGQLLLDDGKWMGQQLLASAWVEEMKTPYVEIDPQRNIKYGYLLWIYEFELNGQSIQAWAASGNGGNYLWIVPKLNMTAVITATAYNQSYMHSQSQEILEQYILPMVDNITTSAR